MALEDARLRTALDDVFDAKIQWRPPPDSHYFEFVIESAAWVRYEDGEQQMQRWRAERA